MLAITPLAFFDTRVATTASSDCRKRLVSEISFGCVGSAFGGTLPVPPLVAYPKTSLFPSHKVKKVGLILNASLRMELCPDAWQNLFRKGFNALYCATVASIALAPGTPILL